MQFILALTAAFVCMFSPCFVQVNYYMQWLSGKMYGDVDSLELTHPWYKILLFFIGMNG